MDNLTEEQWKLIIKKEGCAFQPLYKVRGEYANLPAYMRVYVSLLARKDMFDYVKTRIKFHRKHFDRYRVEVKAEVNKIRGSTISKKNYSQMQYSDKRSYEELAVIDELELILKILTSSAVLKRKISAKQL